MDYVTFVQNSDKERMPLFFNYPISRLNLHRKRLIMYRMSHLSELEYLRCSVILKAKKKNDILPNLKTLIVEHYAETYITIDMLLDSFPNLEELVCALDITTDISHSKLKRLTCMKYISL
jgi:hypothetical protein